MWLVFRRLSFGFALIAFTSSVLLMSDWNRRQSGTKRIPRVAILQQVSQPIIDEGVQGMLAGLAESGFTDGQSLIIRRYNAEGDIATANAIAKEITSGQFDLVLTATTLSLQAVANANKAGKTPHVFGLVSDPFGAGVGIRRGNPLDHPQHLVGIGTMQPVAEAFRLAKKLFPNLQTVGEAWNPAEANSEAQTLKAREITAQLGITLLEANVDNSAGVFEAVSSLVSRGAQALWVGGDVAVSTAFESVLTATRKGGIPVFTSLPGNAQRGALFDLGANYQEVGRVTGVLAGQILHGSDLATLPVEEAVPHKLLVNTQALKGLRDPWRLPDDVQREATAVIDETGMHEKAVATAALQPPTGRVFKVGIAYFAPEPGQESCLQGLLDGLRDQGFVEGRNLEIRKAHAQGEIANIPAVLQNFDTLDLDLIVPMTTPCLTGACSVIKKTPVVFTYVYDPIAAGAGKTLTDHLPNVTGVGSFPPVAETIDVIQQLVPGVRSVGTLYNSSEANSRKVVGVARELFRQRGITLEEVAITSSSEVFQATQVLTHRNIQALWITGDNTALQAFAGIAKVAADARLPLINNDPEFVQQGALVSVGIGWYQTGYATAKVVVRVLRGENPHEIPFENIAVKQLELNHEIARTLGITFSPELVKAAEATTKPSAKSS
ncbi:MAG TPA: ABC transporter substrate-binding protein [Candidatus Binatia bacterium]|nr:ABC transporter substrate-binding protein [Candidatus Binatia bacterium]